MATLEDLIPVLQELSVDNRSVLTRIEPFILTTGKPSAGVGAVGAIAIDMTAKVAYGPKASTGADPWGDGDPFGEGPMGPQGPAGPQGETGPQGPAGSGSGDVLGPATHAIGLVPTWTGANNKTLGAGRAIGAASDTDLLDRQAGDARYVLDSGLNEKVDDRVNALIVAGTGISSTYDDVANTLTLAATGGGGGGGDAAAVFDYTLHRMRQDMGTSVLETPYGYADPLQTDARLNLVASTGEYFATGHVQNQPTSGDGATPTVASTATLAVGTAATSHSLTGLTGAANGREVIVLVAQDGTGTCSATIGGQAMSELGTTSNANVRLTVLRRNLTGAETNLTITITTSGSTTIAAQAYCIAGMQGTPTVALGTTLFDPPSLTSGFGATNTLWLAVTAHEADRNYFAPGSYTNALVTRANATGDFSGSLCSLASVRRGNAVATEDPGAFSIQGTFGGNSVSATIAIRPGPPAAEAMDLRWTAYDLPADPARLNMQFAVEVLGGTLTLGTTLRGWLSRNAGANFTEATLTPRGPAVGGVQVINAIGVDVSGQPAGDDVVARITTTTGVAARILDMAVLAGG
ncbi:MAG: hypothetical protein ACK515_13115 [bacterium]